MAECLEFVAADLPDGVFHVTTRAAFRRLFVDGADRLGFLELLALLERRHRWGCHSFRLKGTHYQLVATRVVYKEVWLR